MFLALSKHDGTLNITLTLLKAKATSYLHNAKRNQLMSRKYYENIFISLLNTNFHLHLT